MINVLGYDDTPSVPVKNRNTRKQTFYIEEVEFKAFTSELNRVFAVQRMSKKKKKDKKKVTKRKPWVVYHSEGWPVAPFNLLKSRSAEDDREESSVNGHKT